MHMSRQHHRLGGTLKLFNKHLRGITAIVGVLNGHNASILSLMPPEERCSCARSNCCDGIAVFV